MDPRKEVLQRKKFFPSEMESAAPGALRVGEQKTALPARMGCITA